MRIRRSSLVVLCVSLALVYGCRKTDPLADLDLTFEFSSPSLQVGQRTLTLTLKRAGKPVTGARIRLEGNMSHAGMAPVFADASEIEPGRYQSTMEFSMAGDWYVVAHVTLPDRSKLDRQFDLKGIVREQ